MVPRLRNGRMNMRDDKVASTPAFRPMILNKDDCMARRDDGFDLDGRRG